MFAEDGAFEILILRRDEMAGFFQFVRDLFPGLEFAAFGIGINMIVAIVMLHGAFGFFMNWTGAQKGEGFEITCWCSQQLCF